MKAISYVAVLLLTIPLFVFTACDEDDLPPEENPEETITNVTLTFTPDGGGTPVLATWVDADGEGSGNPVVSDIELAANTTYIMRIELTNALDPDDPEDITEEVRGEAEEHMLFFGWTEGVFSDPTGSGNIGAGNRGNTVNYDDPNDDNGYPVGLRTVWTTGAASEGDFRIILKHQPDIKSATSDSTDGETDMDATWTIRIQ